MKIKKFTILGAAILLSGCSLGAKSLSLNEFKEMYNREIKVTSVSGFQQARKYLSTMIEERDIEMKKLVETTYDGNTAADEFFASAEGLGNSYGFALTASKKVANFITKEIVNTAGIKTYTDIEKDFTVTSYELVNVKDASTNETRLEFRTIESITTFHTDYLSIALDDQTGRIAKAEIVVDSDIYSFKTEVVDYDTFVKKGDEEEEEEDEGLDVVDISLKDTEWTLSDSTKTYEKVRCVFSKDVDTITSSDTAVGQIYLGNATAEADALNLYIIERDAGSYSFEIRKTDYVSTPEADQVTKSVSYDKSVASDVSGKVKDAVDEYFASAGVLEISQKKMVREKNN